MDIEISSAETFDPIYSELRELKEGIVRINSFHAKAIEAAYSDGHWTGLQLEYSEEVDLSVSWKKSRTFNSLHKESK